jgi:hypothetical protein
LGILDHFGPFWTILDNYKKILGQSNFLFFSLFSEGAKDLLQLKQQELLKVDNPSLIKNNNKSASGQHAGQQISPGSLLLPGLQTPPLSHFVCEGCGITFKSVSNLQAHQARYCAGLRKAEDMNTFEAMLKRASIPQQQQQQQQQQQSKQQAPNMPMLEMMSLLNAKSLEQEKLSSLMMSSMAAAMAAQQANTAAAATVATPSATPPSAAATPSASNGGEDYCCILCGYKEASVERLKDHINLHFIGQVKRKHQEIESTDQSSKVTTSPKNGTTDPPSAKRVKSTETEGPISTISLAETAETGSSEPNSSSISSGTAVGEINQSTAALKCNGCDIGFSHLSNFMAHKKFYCRGLLQQQQKPVSLSTATATAAVKVESGNNGRQTP